MLAEYYLAKPVMFDVEDEYVNENEAINKLILHVNSNSTKVMNKEDLFQMADADDWKWLAYGIHMAGEKEVKEKEYASYMCSNGKLSVHIAVDKVDGKDVYISIYEDIR